MAIDEWVDLGAIKAIARHMSASAAAIVAFGVIGWLIHEFWPPGPTKEGLQAVDSYVVIGLFAILGLKVWWHLSGGGNGTHGIVVG